MVNYECYIRWHAMRDYEALEEILVTARKKVPDPFKNLTHLKTREFYHIRSYLVKLLHMCLVSRGGLGAKRSDTAKVFLDLHGSLSPFHIVCISSYLSLPISSHYPILFVKN